MKTLYFVLLTIVVAGCQFPAVADRVVVHLVPEGVARQDDFRVEVRSGGDAWRELFPYRVLTLKQYRHNEAGADVHVKANATMATCDHEGPLEVRVTVLGGAPEDVRLRPHSAGIQPQVEGNTVSFRLDRPRKMVLEINGNRESPLHLFTNEIETDAPGANDPNVVYFGPGLHEPEEFEIKLKSGQTAYLAGGAVVRGGFVAEGVENVKIRGRGILDHTHRLDPNTRQTTHGVRITGSRNVSVEGLTVLHHVHYGILLGSSHDISIANFKSFSVSSWADGIDMMSCTDVNIDDIFLRNSDDCIAIYNERWSFTGDTRNVSVTNAILWADKAKPMNVGGHGKPDGSDITENILFRNIDVLEHREPLERYIGTMVITPGDNVTVRNVIFDDIRVEDHSAGALLRIVIELNSAYSKSSGLAVHDVLFRNVRHVGPAQRTNLIQGFSEERKVRNIIFENVTHNGLPIDKSEQAITVGKFVEGVRLLTSAEKPPAPMLPLTATAQPTGETLLRWKPVEGATSYRVFAGDGKQLQLVGETVVPQWVLPKGVTLTHLRLEVVNAVGATSGPVWSVPVS